MESYGKVMENSKNSEFHGNLFARKKVMEKLWKSVVQMHHGKSWNFVFEFVWEQCKNIFESKNLIIDTDLYFCTVSCRVPDNKNSQLILVVPSIDRLSNEFQNSFRQNCSDIFNFPIYLHTIYETNTRRNL